ncbi:MAG TPA: hypothetical protein VFZ28_13545, partial [Burkholderiaceae bacterium]|nr:hypothetical protein [Burkholderiaceae bacterium]
GSGVHLLEEAGVADRRSIGRQLIHEQLFNLLLAAGSHAVSSWPSRAFVSRALVSPQGRRHRLQAAARGLTRRLGALRGRNRHIDRPAPKKGLAAYLNISPETLSRLKQKGKI